MARGSFAGGGRRGRGYSRGSFRGNNTSFRGGRGRGRGRGRGGAPGETQIQRDEEGTALAERFEQVRIQDEVDEKLGFARVAEGEAKEGWLINMHPVRCLPYTEPASADATSPTRHWSRTQSGREAKLLSTFSSYKTMAGCSSARCITSHISTLHARYVVYTRARPCLTTPSTDWNGDYD